MAFKSCPLISETRQCPQIRSSPPSFFHTIDVFVSVKTRHRCCLVPGTQGPQGTDHPFGWADEARGSGDGVFILPGVVTLQWESIAGAGLRSLTQE